MANSNSRVGGIIVFTIDGSAYQARGSFEISPSTVKREGIAGQSGVQGYTEMPVVPSIKGDLTTGPNLSMTTLESITDSTVQVTLANGKTYILANAWVTSAFSINAAEGRVGVEFQGLSMTEA